MALGLVLSLAGCGNDRASESDGATLTPSTTTSTTATSHRLLSEKELTEALLNLQEVPPGYSQDPPSPPGASKTFCDYLPPFEEKIRVKRDFTKGGGLSSEFLSVGFRQYADADQAKAAYDAMTDALETCPGETYDGRTVTYSLMSAPKLGAASVGIRITNADGPDLLQFFALVGPVLINTGGGGLMNANADEIIGLFKTQVGKYEAAAKS